MEAAQVNRLDESSKENSLFFYYVLSKRQFIKNTQFHMIMLNGSSMEQQTKKKKLAQYIFSMHSSLSIFINFLLRIDTVLQIWNRRGIFEKKQNKIRQTKQRKTNKIFEGDILFSRKSYFFCFCGKIFTKWLFHISSGLIQIYKHQT